MTETPKPVEVRQADRDAAARYESWRAVEDLPTAFARHRLSTRPEAQSLPTVSGDEIIVGLNDLKFTLERIAEKTPDEQPHYPGGSRPFGTGDLRHLIGVLDAASKRLAALSPTVSEADEAAARVVARAKEAEELVKRMVNRFLNWKLPADFHPDNGISCQRPNYGPNVAWEPVGTNLLSYTQAEAMVLHMLEGEHFTALRAQPSNEADGWRDIASAPKDGSWFVALPRPDLGFNGTPYPPTVCRVSGPTSRIWPPDAPEDFDVDCKAMNCGTHMQLSAFTHWRPLPAAPGEASVQAGGEVERLIEALKFYARASTYLRQPTGGLAVAATPIDCDRGDRARAALNPEGSDHEVR